MWGKAPAVKNSRSRPFDQAIYRTQLGQILPYCHENFMSGGLAFVLSLQGGLNKEVENSMPSGMSYNKDMINVLKGKYLSRV